MEINDISNKSEEVWDILFSRLFTNFAKSKKGKNMEKENIITVDIEDFKDSQHVLDYIDDDFAIVNSLEGTPYSNDTIKLNCFLIAVCIEGCIQLTSTTGPTSCRRASCCSVCPIRLSATRCLVLNIRSGLPDSLPVSCNVLLNGKGNVEYCHSYPQQSGEVGWQRGG